MLHGGPGAGCSDLTRGFFDPKKYRIIQIDQRGCGRSIPHACVEENTTWDLVDDIEKVRKHLNIEQFLVFGGSWGSCLALAYAQTYPQSVSELVLRGIFLLRQFELDWLYQYGASLVYSDAWQKFLSPIAEDQRGDLMQAYHAILFGDDSEKQLAAAKCWSAWETNVVYLHADEKAIAEAAKDDFALAFARIENHYFTHKGWLTHDNQLIDGIDKIRHIPTTIVQGRYDMCTPVQSAWDLHTAFPEAEFHIVHAGHSATEPEISKALVAATDKFAAFPIGT